MNGFLSRTTGGGPRICPDHRWMRQSAASRPRSHSRVSHGVPVEVVVEVRVHVVAGVEPRRRVARRDARDGDLRTARRTALGRSRAVEAHVGPVRRAAPRVVGEQVVDAQRGAVAVAAPRTRRRAATTGRGARRPSAAVGDCGATARNSSSRSTLRFQRGGSCTSVGSERGRRAVGRGRGGSAASDAASRSFMRCEPNAPSFTAYTNPGGAWSGPLLDRRRVAAIGRRSC